MNDDREAALAAGLDRMDSVVPLVDGTPALMDQVASVMQACDDFCADGSLLMLPRPPHLRALGEWAHAELVAQYAGAEPSPWPGPFVVPATEG